MKTSNYFALIFLSTLSWNSFASSERLSIRGNIELMGIKEITLYKQVVLKNGPALVETTTKPSGFFEKGVFSLTQNNHKSRSSIAKDRYKNEIDFSLPSTESGFNLDINLISTQSTIIKTSENIIKETCHTTIFTGTDANNPSTNYATVVGTKDVKYETQSLKYNIKINFFEYKSLKATFKGELFTEKVEKLSESNCKYFTGIRH